MGKIIRNTFTHSSSSCRPKDLIKKGNLFRWSDLESTRATELLHDFIDSGVNRRGFSGIALSAFISNFGDSLGEMSKGIVELNDFSGASFWKQVEYYKSLGSKFSSKNRISLICLLTSFYRWALDTTGEDLVIDSPLLNRSLFSSKGFEKYLERGYRFIAWDPDLEYNGNDYLVWVLRGFNRYSTQFKEEDNRFIRIDAVKDLYYRGMVFRYMVSSRRTMILSSRSPKAVLFADALNLLSDLKSSAGYPIKDRRVITLDEVKYLVSHIENDSGLSTGSKRNLIVYGKQLFNWARNNGFIILDDAYTLLMKQLKKMPEMNPDIISDEDARKLFRLSSQYASVNQNYALLDVLLHLLYCTNVRPGQMCKARLSCFHLDVRKRISIIDFDSSKTSHGDGKVSVPLARNVKEWFDKAMAITAQYRKNIPACLNDYLFVLYFNRFNDYRLVLIRDLSRYLKKLCQEIGLPRGINLRTIRHTFMTKAESFVNNEGGNERQLLSLTGHKSTDVLYENYVSKTNDDYYSAMYLVDISCEDPGSMNGKVEPDLPERSEPALENGQEIGACIAGECEASRLLPCFLCPNFVTTPMFYRPIKKMIDEIDNKFIMNLSEHDREDLLAVKKYLVSILLRMDKIKNIGI